MEMLILTDADSNKFSRIIFYRNNRIIFVLSRPLWVVHSTCTHPIGIQEVTATYYLYSATSFLFASYSPLTWELSIITLDYRIKEFQLTAPAFNMHPDFLWVTTVAKEKRRRRKLLIMIFKVELQLENKVDEHIIN